ncbi:hypothetical protein THTE_4442 [Thermogutta terrifontis]|uniref:Uncharacterized protein n=1 Tax=Thermogutta terrifontis TaxID=1331910 RepID=A0A286RM47_9BACT|nr:hypothetical protein THTE_4442 [Thermogutta terrifontis]
MVLKNTDNFNPNLVRLRHKIGDIIESPYAISIPTWFD